MQIVTGRRGEPHVTSRQMQAVYRSFLGDFALLDIGEKLRAEAYSNDIVRVYDGVVSVQGIYAVIAYNQYDEVYIEPVSVGKKRIDTIVLHYTKDNALDVEDMQLDVVQGEEYTDNPIAPVVPEGGDAWEGTTDIQVAIYDVEVTNFGLTVTPYARMLNLIPTLESIAERIPETVVTGVKGDSEVLYRDGDVNITKANIGLGNVDNTADTDKPISTATQTALNLKADLTYVDAKISAAYHAGGNLTVAELTSALLITENMGKVYNMSDSGVTTSDFVEGAGESILEGDNVGICNVGTEESPVYKFDLLSGFVDLSAYATTSALNDGLAGKVDKVTGKGLSTEDYTTTDKTKLAGIEAQANKTVVDSAMSDSSTNPLQNKVITKELEGSKTATGNPLTIEDAAPVNAVNLSMDLEPIQDLHGYANPWVGGAGKNKLPMTVDGIKAANTIGTWSGNTYTVNGGTFTIQTDNDSNVMGVLVNGTFTGTAILMLINDNDLTTDFAKAILGNTIILNGCPQRTGNPYVQMFNTWGTTSAIYDNGTDPATLAIPSTISGYRCDIVVYEGTVSNVLFKPMIRLSTETDSSFAPYSNICPISGRTEEKIIVSRPNLYIDGTIEFKEATAWTHDNTETAQSITGISASGNVINGTPSTDYFWMHIPFSFRKNRTVYLKFNETPATSMFRISNSNGQYITRIDTKDQYTPSEDFDGFIDLGYDSALFTNYKIGIGYTSTFDIDAYNEKPPKTYTIQFGETVYGGQFDVTRGKMVVDRGYIASYNGETLPSSWISDRDVYTSGTTPTIGAEVVYELAEPYTIQLTPQQIKLLENTNTIYTDYEGDTITIEYQPNNAIGEAVRAVEESYDPEFAVRPVLKSKSISSTTNSSGNLNIGESIIPLYFLGTDSTYTFGSFPTANGYGAYLHFMADANATPRANLEVSGTLYYYELEV